MAWDVRLWCERITFIIIILGIVGTMESRVYHDSADVIASASSFDRITRKKRFVAACFYEDENQINALQAISRERAYQKAGLAIAFIDIAKPRLQTLAKSYDVTSLPTIILFKNGIPLLERLIGEKTEHQIRTFIAKNIGNDLQEAIKEKRYKEEERTIYPYLGFGWGWGYPYYGAGWGYPYGGWGWRGGWYGRRWHHR